MTSSPAARYLEERTLHGIKLGLGPMRALLGALDHPEHSAPCALIAGTNGKGSVAAYLGQALQALGRRVGRYTSPHLQRVNERICVDAHAISDAALEAAVLEVRDAAERLIAHGTLDAHPTYFEVVTAAALLHFRARRVDVTLLEVGMGGRCDATNAAEPLASVIVGIGLDHEAYLGRGLAAIAREKAGVMRRARPLVAGPIPAEAASIIEAAARETGARLVWALDGARYDDDAGAVVTSQRRYPLERLAGGHQRVNAVVAVRALEELAAPLSLDLTRWAPLPAPRWPGRLEWLPTRPAVLLDAAHNPQGAEALAAYLDGVGGFVLLFAAMQDKDVTGMARALFPRARAVVLTRVPIERAAAPEELARRSAGLGPTPRLTSDVRAGLAAARQSAAGDHPIVVAGSLYLVGAVLDELEREGAIPPRAT